MPPDKTVRVAGGIATGSTAKAKGSRTLHVAGVGTETREMAVESIAIE
jgi:hypothetical protein